MPDENLSKTVEALSPASTLPPENGSSSTVVLTREKAEALVCNIHKLAEANLDLFHENQNIKRLLGVGVVIGVALFVAVGYSLAEQRKLHAKLDEAATRQLAQAEARKADAKKVEQVDKKLDEIPRLKVKPADTSDPGAEPVAVLEVPSPKASTSSSSAAKAKRPPKPAAIEIPLAPRRRKKEEKP